MKTHTLVAPARKYIVFHWVICLFRFLGQPGWLPLSPAPSPPPSTWTVSFGPKTQKRQKTQWKHILWWHQLANTLFFIELFVFFHFWGQPGWLPLSLPPHPPTPPVPWGYQMVPKVKKDKKLNENTAFVKTPLKKDKTLNENTYFGGTSSPIPCFLLSYLSFFTFWTNFDDSLPFSRPSHHPTPPREYLGGYQNTHFGGTSSPNA